MSFDPNNPTAIIKDGLIFAAIGKLFQIATDKAEDFVSDMPDDEYEEYEE
tara:strand:+ start:400 stop:549 length:150 start_codon:yes stop_codon:yes gene_type:complete